MLPTMYPTPLRFRKELQPLCFVFCTSYADDGTNLDPSERWRLDTIGIYNFVDNTTDNHIALRDFKRKIAKKSNRHQMTLMIKEPGLGSEANRHLAEKRLLSQLQRFRQQPNLLPNYVGVATLKAVILPCLELGARLFGAKLSKYINGVPNW